MLQDDLDRAYQWSSNSLLKFHPNKCKSIGDALGMVYRSSGVKGLYRGLGPTLIAMFPYVGVEFMVYETLKKRWEMHVGPVGTAALLLLGAAGGAAGGGASGSSASVATGGGGGAGASAGGAMALIGQVQFLNIVGRVGGTGTFACERSIM